MLLVLLAIGGLYLVSKQGGSNVGLLTPKTDYVTWSATPPSSAGSKGTGQTSPLSALLGSFSRNFGTPAPYVPLSGAGGQTVLPAASPAPAGTTQNALTATAPGTQADYSLLSGDVASMSDPRYWWMQGPIDVAIMSEDVQGAMAQAAAQGDLSPFYLEASMGMVFNG